MILSKPKMIVSYIYQLVIKYLHNFLYRILLKRRGSKTRSTQSKHNYPRYVIFSIFHQNQNPCKRFLAYHKIAQSLRVNFINTHFFLIWQPWMERMGKAAPYLLLSSASSFCRKLLGAFAQNKSTSVYSSNIPTSTVLIFYIP